MWTLVEEAAVLHRDRTTGSEKLLDHKHTTTTVTREAGFWSFSQN